MSRGPELLPSSVHSRNLLNVLYFEYSKCMHHEWITFWKWWNLAFSWAENTHTHTSKQNDERWPKPNTNTFYTFFMAHDEVNDESISPFSKISFSTPLLISSSLLCLTDIFLSNAEGETGLLNHILYQECVQEHSYMGKQEYHLYLQ